MLMTDPVAYGELPKYTGLISNVGVLLWCSTAAICLFCSLLLSKCQPSRLTSFFLFGGLLSLILTLDDLFLLHESDGGLFVTLFNIPEKVTLLVYACGALAYLSKFRHMFTRVGKPVFLLVALVLFSISIGYEAMGPMAPLAQTKLMPLLEDGTKFLGIVNWACYFLSASLALPLGTTPDLDWRKR